jgi:hypothetical protein
VGSRAIGVPKIRIPRDGRVPSGLVGLARRADRARAAAMAERQRIQVAWFGLVVMRSAFLIAGAVLALAGLHALALSESGGRPFGMHPAMSLLSGVAALTVALVWSVLLNEPFARMPTATSTDDLAYQDRR